MTTTDDELRFGAKAALMAERRRYVRSYVASYRRASGGSMAGCRDRVMQTLRAIGRLNGNPESYDHECLVSMAQLALAEIEAELGVSPASWPPAVGGK